MLPLSSVILIKITTKCLMIFSLLFGVLTVHCVSFGIDVKLSLNVYIHTIAIFVRINKCQSMFRFSSLIRKLLLSRQMLRSNIELLFWSNFNDL